MEMTIMDKPAYRVTQPRTYAFIGLGLLFVGAISSITTWLITKDRAIIFSVGSTSLLDIPVFKYICTKNQCRQQNLTVEERKGGVPTASGDVQSLRMCEMTCGGGSMLPLPQTISIGSKETIAVNVAAINHQVNGASGPLLTSMQTYFNEKILRKAQLSLHSLDDDGVEVKIIGNIKSSESELNFSTDESYTMDINAGTVTINAATIYGYRHALASLAQLVDYCDISRSIRMVRTASIQDKPAYPYRGLSLDTSRQFYSLQSMKLLIRTMGDHKMNKFHWHISDSASFPIEIKGETKFNKYGLYQSNMAYTQAQVKDFVAYSKIHGIEVIPEIDAPAHAGAGWQWGPEYNMGELTLCWADTPWMPHCWEAPCGQLNPMNEKVYELLDLVWSEMGQMFDTNYFHMGGDEVFLNCWMDSPVITDTMKNKSDKFEYFEIWAKFQERAQNNVWKRTPDKKVILWSSDLTTKKFFKYLPTDKIVVEAWGRLVDNEPRILTDAGYQIISSFQDSHYLDCGLNGVAKKNNGWCDPYKTWQVIYDQELDPNVTSENAHLVIGGEIGLWSEVTGEAVMEAKVWPRAAAFAERTWTNPKLKWNQTMDRMTIAAHRIVENGVNADMIQPLWCRQNPGGCTLLDENNKPYLG